MEKLYYTMKMGRGRWTINYFDGQSCHKDGSPFYGMMICHNEREQKRYIKKLIAEGYRERRY